LCDELIGDAIVDASFRFWRSHECFWGCLGDVVVDTLCGKHSTARKLSGVIESFDGVLVVGAGPVGLVSALQLARAGIAVRVVEAEATIGSSPRAAVYHSPVVERLDRLGLLPDLKQIGVTKRGYHYWNLEHELLGRLSFDALLPEDTPYPFNLHLGQADLAAVVLRHLLRITGVEVRWRARAVAVTQDDAGATVTVQTPEGEHAIRARWVIAADGGHSGMRRALDLKLDGLSWPEWFVATNVRFDFRQHGYGESNAVFDADHWAIIAIIDQTGLWRCTYREEGSLSEQQVRAGQPERYALFAPDLPACQPEAVTPYRVHERCLERFRIGRVLFAGDAAHLVNPIGGLGLTGGLLDCSSLADALLAVIEGRCDQQVLDAWAVERRRVFVEITAPMARENRRRLSERDPERRRADRERLRSFSEDRDAARAALLGVFRLVGRDVLTAG
jgi:2-polyprenyl-6-methoxyphenol hydroxylase-like FAD-dependent oxidoreductase